MSALIKADSLFKKYGSTIAVDCISFEVNGGEVFGFLGPNGAGKTTTIRMMCGLLEPDRGSVTIGHEAGFRSIGICPQTVVVWENLTCMEQLVFAGSIYGIPARKSRTRAAELLESLGLAEKRNALARTLSGGMQRRLNIALALVHSPAIVLLDEPQAGLDPQSRVLVRDYIRAIKSTTTVILTTHDMEEAEKLSDRICIMDKGKLLALGTTARIKRESGCREIFEIGIEGDIRRDLLAYLGEDETAYEVTSASSAACGTGNVFAALEKVLAVVKQRGIKVNGIRLRETSLEDVFIRMTGRSLRE